MEKVLQDHDAIETKVSTGWKLEEVRSLRMLVCREGGRIDEIGEWIAGCLIATIEVNKEGGTSRYGEETKASKPLGAISSSFLRIHLSGLNDCSC